MLAPPNFACRSPSRSWPMLDDVRLPPGKMFPVPPVYRLMSIWSSWFLIDEVGHVELVAANALEAKTITRTAAINASKVTFFIVDTSWQEWFCYVATIVSNNWSSCLEAQ